MALFTMGPAISAGLSLANAGKQHNKNKLLVTGQNQAAIDKFNSDKKSWDLSNQSITVGPSNTNVSNEPRSFYDTSGASKSITVSPSNPLTATKSNEPRSFYDASGSSQTLDVGSSQVSTGPSNNNVKDYLGGLYQGAFDRDPEFNNDPSNTGDYWVDSVSKGQQGDRDWKEWLAASIYGSDEKKGMGSGTVTSDPTGRSTPTPGSGLTLDDLNSWWDTKQGKQPDKFDQFKEFMGLMGGMGGFGGGGVPGFASGGVAAASPYNNFMGFMNAFKSLGGGNQQADISTGNLN